MTDQTTMPPATSETPQQLIYDAIAAGVTLLGMLGIAVPAIFHDQSVMFAAAGALFTLGGSLYSLYSHYVKNDVINTTKAQLVVASAKLSRKPVSRNVN